jgi:hypothetical protein
VVVHLDQSSEQVLVQAAHAAAEAGAHFLPSRGKPPSMAVLAVPDEPALLALREAVEARGIRSRIFREPDFAPLSRDEPGHYSAFATEAIGGELRHAFAELPPVRFRKGVVR